MADFLTRSSGVKFYRPDAVQAPTSRHTLKGVTSFRVSSPTQVPHSEKNTKTLKGNLGEDKGQKESMV